MKFNSTSGIGIEVKINHNGDVFVQAEHPKIGLWAANYARVYRHSEKWVIDIGKQKISEKKSQDVLIQISETDAKKIIADVEKIKFEIAKNEKNAFFSGDQILRLQYSFYMGKSIFVFGLPDCMKNEFSESDLLLADKHKKLDFNFPNYECEMTYTQLKKAIQEANEIENERFEIAKNKRLSRRKKIAKQAKNEGVTKEISRCIDDCDGSVTECNTDILVEYVDKNGNFFTKRIHTH